MILKHVYTKQSLKQEKATDKAVRRNRKINIEVGNFNNPISAVDRTTGHKNQQLYRETANTINQ